MADVLEALDAGAVRRWSRAALDALRANRNEIDRINVFPIADGDTGSNLALTLAAGDEALAGATAASAAEALRHLAEGAVLGARGNSGVIFSQLLRGLADRAAADCGTDSGTDSGTGSGFGSEQLRAGLTAGVAEAYAAVAQPVEGTILTVARAAVEGLPPAPLPLADLVRAAVQRAQDALDHTPDLLTELARAGVVDAGGRGLVVILDALARTVTGGPSLITRRVDGPVAGVGAEPGVRETGSAAFEYEVQYLLSASPSATAGLRARLAEVGDSVAIAGTGTGTWNVHAHVNDVGAAIEAGVAVGAVSRISVVRFADSITTEPALAAARTVVAAVGLSPRLEHLFAGEGIRVVEPGDASADAAATLSSIGLDGAEQLVLLAEESAARTAEAVAARARADGLRAAVVPTRSPVQALAAVAVHDPLRDFDGDVVAMAEAAAATRFAEVRVAEEQALTSVGICQAGDVLGLVDGEVVEIGHGLVPVAFSLAARLAALGAELMTVLVGADAPVGIGALLVEHVRGIAPLTEVAVHVGGQDGSPLIIGVE